MDSLTKCPANSQQSWILVLEAQYCWGEKPCSLSPPSAVEPCWTHISTSRADIRPLKKIKDPPTMNKCLRNGRPCFPKSVPATFPLNALVYNHLFWGKSSSDTMLIWNIPSKFNPQSSSLSMLKIQRISHSCPTFPKNQPAKRLMIHRLWAKCRAGGTKWHVQPFSSLGDQQYVSRCSHVAGFNE